MTNDLKPLEDRRKGYTSPEEALKILESMEIKEGQKDETGPEHTEPDITTPITSTPGFSIEDLSDRYRLYNVKYNRELWVVDWLKELLDNGNEHTLEEWIDLTKNSEKKVPDAPMYHSSCATLFNNKNHPDPEQKKIVEKIRRMFRQDFTGSYMMTSTSVLYKPAGKDIVTHNKGYSNERTINGCIAGSKGYINAGSGFENTINALMGTRDLTEVEQVYGWVTGKRPYLYRLNNHKRPDTPGSVVLGVLDGFAIDACTIVSNWPVRGVITYRAKDFNNKKQIK